MAKDPGVGYGIIVFQDWVGEEIVSQVEEGLNRVIRSYDYDSEEPIKFPYKSDSVAFKLEDDDNEEESTTNWYVAFQCPAPILKRVNEVLKKEYLLTINSYRLHKE